MCSFKVDISLKVKESHEFFGEDTYVPKKSSLSLKTIFVSKIREQNQQN